MCSYWVWTRSIGASSTTSAASECRFIGLLDPAEIMEADHFPIADMLERAVAQIEAHDGPPHAVIGYVDFPVSTMIPIIARRFGLRAPTLESLLRCEHKYWSRLVQREVVAEHIPAFELVDPFGDDPAGALTLDYPFWIKPVKSAGSFLGFRVDDRAAFDHALATIREHIGIFAEPFDHILAHATLPPVVADVGGHYRIAESLIGGRQCTLEGYVFDGAVHFHGVIDSIRARDRPTFLRYQYPSRLPLAVIPTHGGDRAHRAGAYRVRSVGVQHRVLLGRLGRPGLAAGDQHADRPAPQRPVREGRRRIQSRGGGGRGLGRAPRFCTARASSPMPPAVFCATIAMAWSAVCRSPPRSRRWRPRFRV